MCRWRATSGSWAPHSSRSLSTLLVGCEAKRSCNATILPWVSSSIQSTHSGTTPLYTSRNSAALGRVSCSMAALSSSKPDPSAWSMIRPSRPALMACGRTSSSVEVAPSLTTVFGSPAAKTSPLWVTESLPSAPSICGLSDDHTAGPSSPTSLSTSPSASNRSSVMTREELVIASMMRPICGSAPGAMVTHTAALAFSSLPAVKPSPYSTIVSWREYTVITPPLYRSLRVTAG